MSAKLGDNGPFGKDPLTSMADRVYLLGKGVTSPIDLDIPVRHRI